jgi:macrolide transport system ATP-binding/permease protein
MNASTDTPLLQLRGVRREFPAGDERVVALRDIDLDIAAGEMVTIVGASGSGKSTLMNLLGCLDRATSGSYRVAGRDTAAMTPDELAALRREHFGFVFQRYHLLADLGALGNAEMPAVYAGVAPRNRRARAAALLARLGLEDRMTHKPSQLSGGQQQRVSIARALMNGGSIILADEPTGALDSRSGEEVMKLLGELHGEGHTVIIVTHDMALAGHAQRIVELHDGVVVRDSRGARSQAAATPLAARGPAAEGRWRAFRGRLVEAFRMALLAMNAHRARTFLTMLGIIIGIASVVCVVALGRGSEQRVLRQIGALGTNTIDIFPGSGFGDPRAGAVETLRSGDAAALAAQGYVDSASPTVGTSATARFGNASAMAQVTGVSERFFRARGLRVVEGALFDAKAVEQSAQVVLIDENARTELFARAGRSPVGQVILLGRVPCRVVGVMASNGAGLGRGGGLNVWAPYTTVMARMLRQDHVASITVRIADDTPMKAAEHAITKLLLQRHGRRDFYVSNVAQIRATIESASRTLTALVGAIAAIALVVGGIGVMNIMLVSVMERTREIGVRMAVGARQSDILQQFLIEAVLVCLVGGACGVLLAVSVGAVLGLLIDDLELVFTFDAMAAAFACATLIGLVFGFLPARNAARLDPVEALARE